MRILLATFLTLMLSAAARGGEALPRAEWKCTALDGVHLALTGDYTGTWRRLFEERLAERRSRAGGVLPDWAVRYRFHISATEAILRYRPAAVGMLRDDPEIGIVSDAGEIEVVETGFWLSPVGLARFIGEDGSVRLVPHNADAAHYLFLKLSRPLNEGERVVITLPAGEEVEFVRRMEEPSLLFKINQVGYMPGAVKYAYLGAWLGTAGPMKLRHLDGAEFHLRDAESGETVFSGELRLRPDDPVTSNGAPFTGEEVLEADFSGCTRPGDYFLEVGGVGRSEVFSISDRTMAEAFYIHARGLYHQRCGISREPPYTNWVRRACHTECVRGTFPPDISHYNSGKNDRPYGFHTADGKSVSVNHFQLISDNPPRKREVLSGGGWHDAADFDRRPQHMGITGDLAAVYLMKPGNFIDGQLNIPESGNGIPDILDEAAWGLEHLRRMQQEDGGVGTWVETTRHPRPEDGAADSDALVYYLSCATRAGSMEYAAYASCLALALKRAGAEERAAEFAESARRAWQFATAEGRVRPRTYHLGGKTVFYREAPAPAPEFTVKAGLNLFLLLDDPAFLRVAEANAEAAGEAMRRNSWSWSPLFWMEMELFDFPSEALDDLRAARRRSLIDDADKWLRRQERCYPYRIAWFGADEGWVHTMSWGTCHPLRRARAFIAAHALTGDERYLDGAYLANDFQNGANPSGSSMTSGLGRIYPVCFLDINSEADGLREFTPGITPYRNTYGIDRNAVKMAYGLFYAARPDQSFSGAAQSLLPEEGLDEAGCAEAVARMLPVWRRWCNIEEETVAASEFSVWETIAPAAAVTGYLLNGPQLPEAEWIARVPAEDFRTLPGYHPLP